MLVVAINKCQKREIGSHYYTSHNEAGKKRKNTKLQSIKTVYEMSKKDKKPQQQQQQQQPQQQQQTKTEK